MNRALFLAFIISGLDAAAAGGIAEPEFRALTIDEQIQIGYGLAVADVDGDGKHIILADKRQIVWYQNPTWKKFVIAENLTARDNVCVAATNIAGRCDLAVGADWDPGDTEKSGAIFYMIPPQDPRERWTPVRIPAEPTTHRMLWYSAPDGKGLSLVVIPLHGRGDINGEGAGVRVLRYQKPREVHDIWKTTVISDSLHKAHGAEAFGASSDMGQGLLIAAAEGIRRFRSEWSGTEGFSWQEESMPIDGKTGLVGRLGSGDVRLGWIGQKPLIAAIEPMHGSTLAIYLGSVPAEQRTWKREVLTDKLLEGHALACGDFLAMGFDQIAVGWRGSAVHPEARGLALWTPLDADASRWRETMLDDSMSCEALLACDLRQTGRLDLIAAGRGSKNLKIYFNETGASLPK